MLIYCLILIDRGTLKMNRSFDSNCKCDLTKVGGDKLVIVCCHCGWMSLGIPVNDEQQKIIAWGDAAKHAPKK